MKKSQFKNWQRIERIQARLPRVADLYETGITGCEGCWAVEWRFFEGRRVWREARKDAYLLRTNLAGETA